LVKGEKSGLATGLRDLDLAAPDNLGGRVGWVVNRVTQELEPLSGVLVCVCAQRVVVDSCWGTGDLAIVGWRVEVDNVQGGFEESNAGDEGFALNAVFV
jgi:hypothetical protein